MVFHFSQYWGFNFPTFACLFLHQSPERHCNHDSIVPLSWKKNQDPPNRLSVVSVERNQDLIMWMLDFIRFMVFNLYLINQQKCITLIQVTLRIKWMIPFPNHWMFDWYLWQNANTQISKRTFTFDQRQSWCWLKFKPFYLKN